MEPEVAGILLLLIVLITLIAIHKVEQISSQAQRIGRHIAKNFLLQPRSHPSAKL